MKIVSIVGARPQFIKCAPMSKALRKEAVEILVHTGQHYDDAMSRIFFRDLDLPAPDYHLGIGSGPHGAQTGLMLRGIEEVLVKERPDVVIVYGDTNSTLAGALAAAKLDLPVAHVEAGLRSYNRRMPEEINRVVADRVSTWLFCPTSTAVSNLAREGIARGVHLVGDVMYDALMENVRRAEATSRVLDALHLLPREYFLATVHRAENTDRAERLEGILGALAELARAGHTVVLPMHPRLKNRAGGSAGNGDPRFLRVDPLSYPDMLVLEKQARAILTDSGGVQKEARWLGVPCVTLRDETEWVETVHEGWNILAGNVHAKIVEAALRSAPPTADGGCAEQLGAPRRIVDVLLSGGGGEATR